MVLWPETSNISSFTPSEFKKAFDSSFSYSTQHINDYIYTDEERKHSRLKRGLRKDMKLFMVDKLRRGCTKMKREELLKEVNKSLKKIHVKEISMGEMASIGEGMEKHSTQQQPFFHIYN